MPTVARGKALVARLRAQAGVRDPEALAAYLGRFKKARKAGLSPVQAKKVAKGVSKNGTKTTPAKKAAGPSVPEFKSHEEARAWADKNLKGADRVKGFGKASPAAVRETLGALKDFEEKTGSRLPAYLAFNNKKAGRANGKFYGDEQTIYLKEVKDLRAFNDKQKADNAYWENEGGLPFTTTDDLAGVFWHEAGHAVDQAMGRKGTGIASSVDAQRGKGVSEYAKRNTAEGWAEAFAAVATNHRNAKNLPDGIRKAVESMVNKK